MSEESPKLDQLKLIPQVFFDLIARVVPGALGIVTATMLSSRSFELWLHDALGEKLAIDSSVGALIFLTAAYVVGQVLSPLAKSIQRLGELNWLRPNEKGELSRLAQEVRRFTWLNWLKAGPKAEGYDWLRLHYPAAGDQCAKIRAEFTMHNSIAVVLLVAAIIYPFRDKPWEWLQLIALITGVLLAGIRGRTTRDTFNETVEEFVKAAKGDSSLRSQGKEAEQKTHDSTLAASAD